MNKILFICGKDVRRKYFKEEDIRRLECFAEWDWVECDGGEEFGANPDPDSINRVKEAVADVNGIVLAQGSPKITDAIMLNEFFYESQGSDTKMYRISFDFL